MSALLLDLFDRRFPDLVELARARVPNLAPDWTDHNYHDPGIMLVELLAWTAEAQIFALSRMRADERRAYAALLGIALRGPLPAAGLIWPKADSLPAAVLERRTDVNCNKPDTPPFWPADTILLAPARLTGLVTVLADGGRIDQTSANRRDGAGFDPFGPHAGPGDRLELSFECGAGRHLFSGVDKADPALAKAVRLPLGVRVTGSVPGHGGRRARWRVTLAGAGGRWDLPVAADTTGGMLRTGALLLDLGAVPRSLTLQRFTLEFSMRGGFARPPRIECIELNVLPVRQSGRVLRESGLGNGLPGQVLQLRQSGLNFDSHGADLAITVAHDTWEQRRDFESSGPGDRHYVVDTVSGQVTFGNGVNGKAPPMHAQILLDYAFSAGAAGNLPRLQGWTARGVVNVDVGTNLDPMTGGADPSGLDDLRRAARREVREAHALVSAQDLVHAALAAPDLQAARAELVGACGTAAAKGVLTMVALRARSPGRAGAEPEPPHWLQALQRSLATRLPMGQRLRVIAPRYVKLVVKARLAAAPLEDPERIRKQAIEMLAQRLAVVADTPEGPVWQLGLPVSVRQVEAWLRRLPGVGRVTECQLYRDDSGEPQARIVLPRVGLPLFDGAASSIAVERQGRSS